MRKKEIAVIFVSIIIVCINNISLSSVKREQGNAGKAEILKPVIEVIQDETIEAQMNQYSIPLEYNFSINNYNGTSVNEADFEYVIEIENSQKNFPARCFLYDIDNDMKISINNGKSPVMKLDKFSKISRRFKICIEWIEKNGALAQETEIKLKINAIQERNEKSI